MLGTLYATNEQKMRQKEEEERRLFYFFHFQPQRNIHFHDTKVQKAILGYTNKKVMHCFLTIRKLLSIVCQIGLLPRNFCM